MSKLLRNVIIGVASGAAAAYFLSTEKGKELQKKATKAYQAYKENPSEYHQKAKDKATEYTDLAVDTFNDYKEKFESGELTTDEFLEVVKEKGQAAADFASEKVSEFTSKVSEAVDEADDVKEETKAEVDDIIIDYTPKDETPASENEKTETTEDKE
ncbi:YtxH domain-containing protein [Streptococcus equinus]|uniref:YtxH domain-containing protein n=1 Tax=Streptococcus equinus TaxID=1335 RepID=UPI0008E83B7D|nr:YtxH domain-containing protein [Streptococcus equinus]QGX45642.1 YtxH domain-containing protein [Streptococcus equinus]UOC10674.1 YtxH domain-containing protein [Streptococcus equinus]SFQ60850.1 Gas vesicle protein [Streptococcus equinus]